MGRRHYVDELGDFSLASKKAAIFPAVLKAHVAIQESQDLLRRARSHTCRPLPAPAVCDAGEWAGVRLVDLHPAPLRSR